MTRRVLAALIALSALGCGSKGAVSLGANVQNPELLIEQLTLGPHLSGGFELRLELGSEATGNTSVSLESFALVRASDQSALVAPLPAAPQGVEFPLDVPKGQTKLVSFVLDDQLVIDSAQRDSICAEPVEIVGSVRDSLSGGESTPLRSISFTISGC
jgi:hypothetical protein